ncbi:MAG: hypothetical protein IPN94_07260 [Sphingobacteriales bacterium]|nr:hypothetical protein [Sphingobacteriales bacterium]
MLTTIIWRYFRFNQQQYSANIGLLHQVVFGMMFYNTEACMLLLHLP